MNTTIWEECVLTLSELEAYTLQVNDKCVALQEEEKEIVSQGTHCFTVLP